MKYRSALLSIITCLLIVRCSTPGEHPQTQVSPGVDNPPPSPTAGVRIERSLTQNKDAVFNEDWYCSNELSLSTPESNLGIQGEILLWMQGEEYWDRHYLAASDLSQEFSELSVEDQFPQGLDILSFGSSPDLQKYGFFPYLGPYDSWTNYFSSEWKVVIYSDAKVEVLTIDISDYLDRSERGFPLSSWGFSQWISEDYVMVTFTYPNPDDWKFTDEVVTVLNLSSLTWQEELITQIPGTLPSDGDLVSISPDLTRMLFGTKGSFSLYDRDTYELIRDSIPHVSSRQIRWQGSQYFVSSGFGNSNPAIVDRFGNLYLEEFPEDKFGFTSIDDIQWAPNHLWLGIIGTIHREDNDSEKYFKVFDILSQEEVYSCRLLVSGDPIKPNFFYWSPDADKIVYSAYLDMEPTYILNLSSGETYKLAEKAIVLSWTPFSFHGFE